MTLLRAACVVIYACALGVLVTASGGGSIEQTAPGAGAVLVFETAKGAIEVETYPEEAPKTVARIIELVKKHCMLQYLHFTELE